MIGLDQGLDNTLFKKKKVKKLIWSVCIVRNVYNNIAGSHPIVLDGADFSDMLWPTIKNCMLFFNEWFLKDQIHTFQLMDFNFLTHFSLPSHRSARKENTPPFPYWWALALNIPSLLDQIRWGSWTLWSLTLYQCIENIFLLQFCNHNYAIYKNHSLPFLVNLAREIFTRWCPRRYYLLLAKQYNWVWKI